jgi:uncharacterized beta-barrel protein YwiB (DUF1934 family)
MKKKAVIKVISTQRNSDDKAIEVVTPGEFYREGDYYYAVYDETELSGMAGTKTTIKVSPETFLLTRTGTTNGEMSFKKDDRNITLYDTPYGALQLNIDTKELHVQLDDNGGEIFIDYSLSVGNQEPQNTLLRVNIKA